MIEYSTPFSKLKIDNYVCSDTYYDIANKLGVPYKNEPVICVRNGEPVFRKDWGNVVGMKEDEIRFIIVPRGQTFKNILRTIAVIALGILAGPIATVLGFAAGTIGFALVSAAIVIGGTFLINAFLGPNAQKSKAQQTTEAASPTYNLEAQGNRARLLEPIPRLYGRHIIYPDFASQPYQNFENNDQYLYELLCLGVGEYVVEKINIGETELWNNVSGYSDTFSNVQIEIIPPGGRITLFPSNVNTSSEVNGQEMVNTSDWVGPYVANPNNQATDHLQIDIVLPRGLYYANDSGGLSNASVSYTVQVRAIDNLGDPLGGFVTVLNETFTLADSTQRRYTRDIYVSLGRYEVQVRRTSTKQTDARYGNDIVWQALRAFIPDDNIYQDITLLAIKIRASNQLTNQSSTQVNVVQVSKIPVWDGAWSGNAPCDNPAWVATDILRNTVYGAAIPDSRIDLEKLRDLAAVYTARGDAFNGIFDTSKTLWDALTSVLSVVRTQPILVAGMVTFVRDQQRSLARTVITPQSILKNTFKSTHIAKGEDSADDVIVEFMDSTTWENSEVQCTLPGSASTKPARIQIFGITDRSQAWREGMYRAASNSYRRIFASVSTEADGRLLLKGDPVIVSHDVPGWSQNGLVVDYLPTDKILIFDRNVSLSSSQTNYISLRRRDGKEFGPIQVTATEFANEVSLESGSLQALELSQGMEIEEVLSLDGEAKDTAFVLGSTTEYKKRFIVVGSTMRGVDKVDLDLVIDDPRVYAADAGTPPPGVSYYGPGVIADGPVVDSLHISQDPLSGSDPVLINAIWSGAIGAVSYILQISYDGINWITVYSGTRTNFQITANAGDIYVRVAAVNTIIGPWKYIDPNPQNFGTPSLLPGLVSNLDAAADVNAGTIQATFNAAPRATSYRGTVLIESSPGSGTFNTVKLTKTVSSPFLAWTSSEVTAVGGPWSRIQVNVYSINDYGESAPVVDQILGITLGAVTGLSLTNPYTGVESNIQWNSVANAALYRVKIFNNVGTQVKNTTVTTNSYFYSNSQLIADGGPWRSFSVRVSAENASLTGPETTLNIADNAPAAPTTISSTSPSAGRIDITWSAVSGSDITKYQVFMSTVNGFAPATSNRVFDANALGCSITGLASGTTYYYRVSTIDSYAGGNGYLYSTQFSRTAA
jgi:hypothetical protein